MLDVMVRWVVLREDFCAWGGAVVLRTALKGAHSVFCRCFRGGVC